MKIKPTLKSSFAITFSRSKRVFNFPAMFQGIVNGQLGSNMVATTSCKGQSGEFFVCSGTNKFVTLHSNKIGTHDFVVQSDVYVEKMDWTSAYFMFVTNANEKLNFGLDGKDRRYNFCLCYQYRGTGDWLAQKI